MATYQKRGNRWRVQIRHKGLKPLTKSFATKREAMEWAEARDEPCGGLTLGSALERYLKEVTPTKKGAKQEGNRIRLLCRHRLAERALTAITSSDIAEYRNEYAGKAPTTVRNSLTILSQVYETARLEWGLTSLVNPVRGVRLPKHRPGRNRRLHDGEEEALLAACRSVGCAWLEPLVILAIETAMRQGELLALDRRCIRDRFVYLRDTKTSVARSVPLTARALEAIARLDVEKELFPYTGHQVSHYYNRARAIAGLDDLRFHDLRHEATSRLFEKGLNAFEVMSVTGHKTTDMLKNYTHFSALSLLQKL